jgi:hypothetical protein
VAVHDWNTVASGRDTKPLLLNESSSLVVNATENLAGLSLELVLLARDEGDNVIDDVHAGDSRVTGTRNGLQSNNGDGRDRSESGLESGEGNNETNDSAVGVAHEETLVQRANRALMRDEVEMGEVDGGNDERHERIATVVLCVREDRNIGLDELELNIASDVRVKATEDNITVLELLSLAFSHNHLGNIAHGRGLLPSDGILVLLAGRAR